MSIPPISPNSVVVNPTELNPHVQVAQSATVAKSAAKADKAIEKTKTDSVTISRQAATMAARVQKQEDRQGKEK
ncbi:hypothetical protein [Geobacter argillaceus]|uniref:Uncharacterized protein n=1 Tax=Geobacter argillaceus TaxID=345631 RepID=A0A562V6B8_9BACT|nr:hypothetical protein [Geobacter argillaceus]TWJ13307.1 hypothetical protein JN12_03896 [Geobacter argillaceus]